MELFAWNRVEHQGLEASMPPPSCCQSMVQFEERMYIFGGAVLGVAFNAVHSFDTKTEQWSLHETKNSGVASSRMSHSTVVFEESMVVFGGMDPNVVHGDLLSLNLRTFEWSVLPSQGSQHPGVRRSHAAAVHGCKMYISMGLPSHRPPDLWSYDFGTKQWAAVCCPQLFGVPPVSLHGHSMCVSGNSLYLFGGCLTTPSGASSYSNSLYEYNITTNLWTAVRVADYPMPSPRYAHVMAISDGRIIIHGGDSDDCAKYYDDLWLIDLRSIKGGLVWQKHRDGGTRRPCARSGHCCAVLGDALYIFGGESPGAAQTTVHYSNQLYRIPLTLSTRLPLTDLCGRWLAKATDVDDVCIPPAAASVLKRYRRIEGAEKLATFHHD
jgi:N-acetylneuraminic acid mutarotase